MIYNLPEIEKAQIEFARKGRIYRIERDRLKPRFFLYASYPTIDFDGLNVTNARKYVYVDFMARFLRLQGYNVLYSLGYNNTNPKIIDSEALLSKPAYSIATTGTSFYENDFNLLDLSIDSEKEIYFDSPDFVKYVQKNFALLYEAKVISYYNEEICFDDKKLYAPFETVYKNNNYYDLNGNLLKHKKRSFLALNLKTIKNDLLNDLKELALPNDSKEKLLGYLGIYEGLTITLNTAFDELLTFKMARPELLCGVSFIALNPLLMDVTNYLATSEAKDGSFDHKFYFTGNYAINIVNGFEIPIFISTYFDEAIHLGIPSISDDDENLALNYDLPFEPIFDYIGEEKIIVNSGYLTGYSVSEAHKMIVENLTSSGYAKKYEENELSYLPISSLARFGIPAPLKIDMSLTSMPLIYDSKHDVKLLNGEVCDREVVKDFLCDEFVSSLLPNAIRLKNEVEIMEYDTSDALNEITRFDSIDLAVYDDCDLPKIFWAEVLGLMLSKYYVRSFKPEVKQYAFSASLFDDELKPISIKNHNLVAVKDIIRQYGSSVLRYFYAINGNINDSYLFSIDEIKGLTTEIEQIIKVFYYPLDEYCRDLDYYYQQMISDTRFAMSKFDVKTYLEAINCFVKKVHEVKHIARQQGKGLLIILSVIMPSLAEQIKCDVLNLKDPLAYFSFPE